MCMFGYLKTPDIILSHVFSYELDWSYIVREAEVILGESILLLNCPLDVQ